MAIVPDDTFAGQFYYRQPVPALGKTPQAFTVLIGDRLVSSMMPYCFMVPIFIGGSEGYIPLALHESLHEMEIWRQGYLTNNYIPLPEMSVVEDFNSYSTFYTALQREADRIRRMADSDGESLFYFGMAQAALLERLFTNWKSLIWMDGIWLETLVVEALR